MGIEAKFNMNAIHKKLEAFKKEVDASIITTLGYLGEELTNYAKMNITFTPRSGNLQNSTGYVVVKNGKVVLVAGFGDVSSDSDGEKKGTDLALKLAKETKTSSYALIIVAGMEYAASVEARGYNVILPAELLAKTEFPKVLKELMERVNKKLKF